MSDNDNTLSGSDRGDVASDHTRYQIFATPMVSPDEDTSQDKRSSQQNPSTSDQDLANTARADDDLKDLKRKVDELTNAMAKLSNLLPELVGQRRSQCHHAQPVGDFAGGSTELVGQRRSQCHHAQPVGDVADGSIGVDDDASSDVPTRAPVGAAPLKTGDVATKQDNRHTFLDDPVPKLSPGYPEGYPAEEPLNSTRISAARDVSTYRPMPLNQINPSKFDGDSTRARSWLIEYETAMEINGFSDELKLKRAAAYLTDKASSFYSAQHYISPGLDWMEFKTNFLETFCGLDVVEQLRKRIENSRQTSGESPVLYVHGVLDLCMQLECLTGTKMETPEVVNKVTSGLTREVRNFLAASRLPHEWTLTYILRMLKAFTPPPKERPPLETSHRRNFNKSDPNLSKPIDNGPTKPKNLATWTCFNCNNKGHVIEECKEPRNENLIKERTDKHREDKKSRQVSKVASDDLKDSALNLPCDGITKPLLIVDINGQKVQGLIDSGADMTIIPSDVAEDCKLPIIPWKEPALLTADKSTLNILGMVSMIVTHENKVRPILAAVLPRTSLSRPLLGSDFLHAFSIKIEFKQDPPTISTINTQTIHPLDKVQFGVLDVAGRNLFDETLLKFGDTFSRNEQDIGRTSSIKHRIHLSDDKPVHKPPYRIPVRLRDTMQAAIDKLKATGAIRESQSPYASPVFFVDKDHGQGKRLVADYRALNAKTIPDRTPMPHPEDVFGMLANMKIFAKLDITSMFNQIEVDERDIEKTAISTPFGLYECPLMSFGLINAPATAVRLMKTVLRGLDGKIAYVYFDDIIVFAEDTPQLVQRCTEVLQRLKNHNLKLKPTKCVFGVDSIRFLGHVISARGIIIDERRIQDVKNFPTPKNPTDVRSFHGLCSYNRKFIRGFADIAKPLTPLMGKPSEFVWTSSAQKAFEELRDALIKAPILTHFNPDAQHELRTDASNYAIGAVLYQKHEDSNQCGIVLYYSKTLNKAQRNYSATERELLAAFTAIEDLQHYLFGKKFTLVTDHAALSLLRNHRDPHNRLARWVSKLQVYEFDVVYKKGSEHLDADCMSRLIDEQLPTDVDVDIEAGKNILRIIRAASVAEEVDQAENVLQPLPVSQDEASAGPSMKTDQCDDPYCRKYIDILQSDSLSDEDKAKMAPRFSLQDDGLLYRLANSGELTLVIPLRRRAQILKACHDSPLGAHLGFSRTYAIIRARYYWPKLRKEIKRYTSSCSNCQRRKAKNTPKQGFIRPLPVAEDVFDTIGIDLITKLPRSHGYNTILVCTDNLSKYVITVPLKNELADTIFTAFFNFVIAKHGCPKLVISDRGSNLIGATSRNLFSIYGIKRQLTSPRHPQSNGQTERFNRTLAASLTMYVHDRQEDWSVYLQAVTFAYNISEHSVTRVTPYELVFNRRARLPIDNIAERNEFVDPLRPKPSSLSTAAMQLMRGFILESQQVNKRRLDSRRVPCTYKEGDLVVVERPTRARGGVGKLTYQYVGPYKIIKKIGDLNFEIVSPADPSKSFVVHPALIKSFVQREAVEDEQLSVPDFIPREQPMDGSDAETVDADECDECESPPMLSPHSTDQVSPPHLVEHIDIDE